MIVVGIHARTVCNDSGRLCVGSSLADVVAADKTIERLDESITEEIAVFCHIPRLYTTWCREKLWCFAQQLLYLVGSEQRVLCVRLVQDIMDRVVRTSKFQLRQGHIKKASFNQRFHRKSQPFLKSNP